MEKELPPPESMTSVNIKPEYAPSEVYSSEPPPAYQRPKSASVQVAKIIAVTVVLVSVVLGGCILASAYITANASCKHLEQELQLITESMDRFQPLMPEALIQEEPLKQQTVEPLEAQETKAAVNDVQDNAVTQDSSSSSSSQDSQSSEESSDSNSSEDSEEEERVPVHIKLPLQIDFDDIAGAMMEKNQRSKMNCIVEKKKAEEVIDHQAKTVNLPFGVNLTTDPRYERVSGERIAIFCESGNFQRQADPQDQEETIMIQPVMIPLPPPQFHTHMPMQVQPQVQIQQQQQQQPQQLHPMETMRPPMPSPMIQIQQTAQSQLPPSQILHHIAQQIIAQKLQQEAQRAAQEEVQTNELKQESDEQPQISRINVQHIQPGMGRIPIPEEILTQINRLPNRDVIVAVSHHEPPQEVTQQQQQPEIRVMQHQRQSAHDMNGRQSYARGLPVNIPVPMMQQEQEAAASDEDRVHFVHPRSIRSVEDFIPKSQKRVKRCNCDCAC